MADSRQKWLPNREMSRPCTAHNQESWWPAPMLTKRISSNKSNFAVKSCNGVLLQMWHWRTETVFRLSTCHSVKIYLFLPAKFALSSFVGVLWSKGNEEVEIENVLSGIFVLVNAHCGWMLFHDSRCFNLAETAWKYHIGHKTNFTLAICWTRYFADVFLQTAFWTKHRREWRQTMQHEARRWFRSRRVCKLISYGCSFIQCCPCRRIREVLRRDFF